MLLSYNWLSEFLELPVKQNELADVLTWLGLEVEAVHYYSPSLESVVIGEVIECAHIEGTDHLSITKVDVGGESLSVVCGAPNVRVGLRVAVMLAGATTAAGMKIKKAKLRGHESHGMIASEQELGLSNSHGGILELPLEWKIGAPASQYLNSSDTVYDVEITPNRPDFLSHIGVARDIAAKFRIPWQPKRYTVKESAGNTSDFVKVEILAPDACPRYDARVIKSVEIAPSPFEVCLRLARCGIRPISNIVDVTNYLMLEYGQPLHAFDARFVEGREIRVRFADEKEKFTTLDGQVHLMHSDDLLIADKVKGIAVAGVMGGLNSEIREDTKDVIIECAYFDPVHVRRTARALGMSTDSSRRFERGCDPENVPHVATAAAALMQEWGGGEILAGVVDCHPKPVARKVFSFRPRKASELIGINFDEKDVEDILVRLGCSVKSGGETWQVEAPSWRPDLEREVDLTEEIIRVRGYDEIPTAETSGVALSGRDDELFMLKRTIEDILVGQGFLQAVSLSMWNPELRRDPPGMPEGVEVANPVTDEMKFLQGSVLTPLFRAASANFQRGDRDLRLFETTRSFRKGVLDDPRTWERQVVAGLLTGRRYPQGWTPRENPTLDFFDLKGLIEILGRRLSLDKSQIICYDIDTGGLLRGEWRVREASLGNFGIWPKSLCKALDLDADVLWFEFDLAAILAHRPSSFAYTALPRFPLSWRDVAVVVDSEVTAEILSETIRSSAGEWLSALWPFDVFESDKLGVGKKSVALRLEFQHPERSLDAAEVDAAMQKVIQNLTEQHSAQLR
jgi:phenylalanyl-tRNA synthetase beta chain